MSPGQEGQAGSAFHRPCYGCQVVTLPETQISSSGIWERQRSNKVTEIGPFQLRHSMR